MDDWCWTVTKIGHMEVDHAPGNGCPPLESSSNDWGKVPSVHPQMGSLHLPISPFSNIVQIINAKDNLSAGNHFINVQNQCLFQQCEEKTGRHGAVSAAPAYCCIFMWSVWTVLNCIDTVKQHRVTLLRHQLQQIWSVKASLMKVVGWGWGGADKVCGINR